MQKTKDFSVLNHRENADYFMHDDAFWEKALIHDELQELTPSPEPLPPPPDVVPDIDPIVDYDVSPMYPGGDRSSSYFMLFDDVSAGDPERKGKYAYYVWMTGAPRDIVWQAATDSGWKNDYFTAGTANTIVKAKASNAIFLNVMKNVFSINRAYIEDVIDNIPAATRFTLEEESEIVSFLRELYYLTEADLDEYQSYIQENYSWSDNVKTATPGTMKYHTALIREFRQDKLNNITDLNLVYQYVMEDDPEKEKELEDLINDLVGADYEAMQSFMDKTGVSGGEFAASLFGGIITAYYVLDEDYTEEDKKLQEQGFHLGKVYRFIELFQERALRVAFEMIEENYRLLLSEEERYQNLREVKKLYDFAFKSAYDAFNAADYERARAVQDFLRGEYDPFKGNVEFDLACNLIAGDVLNKLLEYRHDVHALAAYIHTLQPSHLFKILKNVMHAQDIKGDTADGIMEYLGLGTGVTLQVTGAFDEKEYHIYGRYSGLARADAMDANTYANLAKTGAEEFPILADLSIDFRRLILLHKRDYKGIRDAIYELIAEKKENAEELYAKLQSEPEKVWELDGVMAMVKSQYHLNIQPGTIPDLIIDDIVQDVANSQLWVSLGLAAVGIVLGIAGFFTFGATWAAIPLLIGSAVVSGIDFMIELERYNFRSMARDTAIGDYAELSYRDPELFGLVMAVFGLVIDFFAVFKLAKAGLKIATNLGKTMKAADALAEVEQAIKLINKGEDIVKQAERIYDVLGPEHIIGRLSKEEFVKRISDLMAERGKHYDELADLMRLYGGFDFGDLDVLTRYGLVNLYEQNNALMRTLLDVAKEQPAILSKYAMNSLLDPAFAKDLSKLIRVEGMTDELVADFLRFFGESTDSITDFKGLAHLFTANGVTDPDLLRRILWNPVVSQVESSKIRIAFKKDFSNPDGYILDSAYPLYE